MKNELSSVEKRLLLGAVADIQRLKKGKPLVGTSKTNGFFALKYAVEDARAGFIRLDAARWLDQKIEPSDRMMVSRAYARLEKRGLLEKVSCVDGPRPTHFFITPAGFKLARELQTLQRK